MREIHSTVTSKGQVTIPVEVRRHLGIGTSDKVSFVIEEDGVVSLRPVRLTVAQLRGIVPALPNETPDLEKEIEEAMEEEAERVVRAMGGL